MIARSPPFLQNFGIFKRIFAAFRYNPRLDCFSGAEKNRHGSGDASFVGDANQP